MTAIHRLPTALLLITAMSCGASTDTPERDGAPARSQDQRQASGDQSLGQDSTPRVETRDGGPRDRGPAPTDAKRPADSKKPAADRSTAPYQAPLCGERSCDPVKEDCCLASSGTSCVPRGSCRADKINCLLPRHCPTNQSCCFFVDNRPIDIACVYTCPALTLCESSADCPGGVECMDMTESISVCRY